MIWGVLLFGIVGLLSVLFYAACILGIIGLPIAFYIKWRRERRQRDKE